MNSIGKIPTSAPGWYRLVDCRWFWFLFAAAAFTPLIDVEVGQGNVASDLAAIESLTARGTFFINDSPFAVTLDKFKRGDHYFSQKSPIFHLVGAVPIWAMMRFGWSLPDHPAAGLRILTFFMVILPMGWLLFLIHHNPWVARLSPRRRLAMTLAFGGGSLLTPFAITFNHYIAASAFLMAAFNTVLNPDPAGFRRGLQIGGWVSLSIACDIPPAFLFGAGVAAWLAFGALRTRRDISILAGVAAGAMPVAILYAALNLHILGSPLPPNFHEREMLYYEGSFWAEQQAKIARGEPDFYEASYLRRMFHATLGYKGIYWMMPLLALATLAALYAAGRTTSLRLSLGALIMFPLVTLAVVMRWALDHGGGQYVVRHVFATVAPLYCSLALARSLWESRVFRRLFFACSLWGAMMAGIGFLNPWSHNVLSAFPPLENLSRFCLAHSRTFPAAWIGPVINNTSVTPANGWLDLGLDCLGRKDLRAAEDALKRGIAADPGFTLAYYHLGIALDMQNRPREAMETYDKLLVLDPGNGGAWNNLGIFSLRAGDAVRARAAFDHSLELNPDNSTAIWGLLLLEGGAAAADSPLLRRALEIHPDDPRIQAIARSRGLTP